MTETMDMDACVENRNMLKGNTFRFGHRRNNIGNPELSIARKYEYDYESGTKTYGITEIDEKFGLMDRCFKTRGYYYGHGDIKMNNEKLWNDLFDAFMEYRCWKTQIVKGTAIFDVFTFKIPVKEYCIEENGKDVQGGSQLISYNGRHYDPEKIYIIEEGTIVDDEDEYQSAPKMIKELCGCHGPDPFTGSEDINLLGIINANFSCVGKKRKKKRTNTGGTFSSHFERATKITMNRNSFRGQNHGLGTIANQYVTEREVIVDLKNTNVITHIGMLAPHIYTKTIDLNEKEKSKNKKYLLTPSDLYAQSWVTGIKVWYKMDQSDTWVDISEHGGNHNCHEMNLINLQSYFNTTDGLQCRYLKIAVKSFHRNPSFRLAVYGKKTEQVIKKKENDFVKYEIEFPVTNEKKVPDGMGYGRYWYWRDCYNKIPRTTKKRWGVNDMKYDMNDDRCDYDDDYDYDEDRILYEHYAYDESDDDYNYGEDSAWYGHYAYDESDEDSDWYDHYAKDEETDEQDNNQVLDDYEVIE
jgi:hypothetical protein